MYKKLQEDLKEAIKTKDRDRLSVIRLLSSKLKDESINLHVKEISDDVFFDVLKKYIKQNKENIINYNNLNREDLAKKEEYELSILELYMPVQLSEDELIDIIKKEVSGIADFSQKDIGVIIKNITEKYTNRVDGKRISDIIRKLYL
jgi:uncharacterized protein YqeY